MANRYYQGPPSDHFDGERFFNPGVPVDDKGLMDILRWRLTSKRNPWPDRVLSAEGVRPRRRVEGIEITQIGHASLLIQANNTNFLIDPVWSERASPLSWAGPRRHNPPAIEFEDLPPIDVLLLTHNHYDHMDTDSIGRVWQAHRPRILTPLGNDAIIRKAVADATVETGDWWRTFEVDGGRVTIVPSYHWSSRNLRDRRMALWGGFVIDTPAGNIYCAGDTAYRDGAVFPEIRRRLGPARVAIVPVGAYEPRWFMRTQHADPEEAIRIAMDIEAEYTLGIHWGTFPLTDEPYSEPATRFDSAVLALKLDPRCYRAMRAGDVWTL